MIPRPDSGVSRCPGVTCQLTELAHVSTGWSSRVAQIAYERSGRFQPDIVHAPLREMTDSWPFEYNSPSHRSRMGKRPEPESQPRRAAETLGTLSHQIAACAAARIMRKQSHKDKLWWRRDASRHSPRRWIDGLSSILATCKKRGGNWMGGSEYVVLFNGAIQFASVWI